MRKIFACLHIINYDRIFMQLEGLCLANGFTLMLQILDMTKGELDMLAKHLGHDTKTHKEYYRLAHSTLELSKVINLQLIVLAAFQR